MSRSELVRAVALLAFVASALAAALTTSACELSGGACLRMSDCDVDYVCVEGTCRSDHASDDDTTKPAAADAGKDASRDASRDAARAADATVKDAAATSPDASRDGAPDA